MVNKQMKKIFNCISLTLLSLDTKEMQIKILIGHYMSIRMTEIKNNIPRVGEDVEQLKFTC